MTMTDAATYGPWLDSPYGLEVFRQHGESGRTWQMNAEYANALEALLAEARDALANLDAHMDFTEEYTPGPDGGGTYDNVEGINAALKQAHEVLARIESLTP